MPSSRSRKLVPSSRRIAGSCPSEPETRVTFILPVFSEKVVVMFIAPQGAYRPLLLPPVLLKTYNAPVGE